MRLGDTDNASEPTHSKYRLPTTYVSPRSQTLSPRPRSPPEMAPTQVPEPLSVSPRLKLGSQSIGVSYQGLVQWRIGNVTHSSALIVQSLPPQENATSGGESHGYVYSPCDSSYTPEPSTWSQNDWAASVGAVMMVLPESMIVSNLSATLSPPTDADAPHRRLSRSHSR